MINEGLFTSKIQTWETPHYLFDKLNKVFKFDIDVCALPATAKCDIYYTPELDGLKQKWSGNCWMNPPYGREQIEWLNKAYDEFINNAATIVCLIPARPDTKIWHELIFRQAKGICFIKGRLKFGDGRNSAPFPSALIIFSERISINQEVCLRELGAFFKK